MAKEAVQSEVAGWFAGRLPDGWFTGPPDITVDSEEIVVVGKLADDANVKRFREETRQQRMKIADEAERKFGRTVSWGAEVGDTRKLFTTVSVPMMTRLRLPERAVLDTLVESGVARSRSEALGWCVRLVGKHQSDWIEDLRSALVHVQKVRAEGPRSM